MNIIFDLGGVVFNWKPDQIISRFFSRSEDQILVRERVLNDPDWAELDRGTLTYSKAIMRAAARTGLTIESLSVFFNGVPSSLTPVPETVELILRIKEQGHRVYLLSNMHIPSMNYLEKNNDFMNLFDGKIYSCDVKQVKPDREIYQTILNTFSLIPEETVFIDDTLYNLSEPKALGIIPIHFKNPVQCKEELTRLGCLSS